jgi:tryptophan synthase alpha chain
VPDIPLEETTDIRATCMKHGLELVLLATPTTPQARMADIARTSQGFVYLVSVTGVTGARANVETRVEQLVEMLHSVTDKSVAVGFGVSSPEHARQIVEWGAEGVICGSALVKALGESGSPEAGLKAMGELASSLRAAI